MFTSLEATTKNGEAALKVECPLADTTLTYFSMQQCVAEFMDSKVYQQRNVKMTVSTHFTCHSKKYLEAKNFDFYVAEFF